MQGGSRRSRLPFAHLEMLFPSGERAEGNSQTGYALADVVHIDIHDSLSSPRTPTMRYDARMVDRQIGRNAELFAQSIAEIDSKEERYPYLRILVSLIEQAHPEWRQAPNKAEQMANLACELSNDALDGEEVEQVVTVRDRERGYHN